MRIDVVTIFPELLAAPLATSIMGRAVYAGLVEFGVHDLREQGIGRHRSVDDAPYGGARGHFAKTVDTFLFIVYNLNFLLFCFQNRYISFAEIF